MIQDNGIGFSVPRMNSEFTSDGKLGIAGMQQRARFIEGDFLCQSEFNKGTIISIKANCGYRKTLPSIQPSAKGIFKTPREKASVLKFVVATSEGDPITTMDKDFASRFNKHANGTFEIVVYPGQSLIRSIDYFDAIRNGTIDIMDFPFSTLMIYDNRLGAFEQPFMFKNIWASAFAQKDYVKLFDPICQRKLNIKALASWTEGGMELISKIPIKTLANLQGLRIGTFQPMTTKAFSAMGAIPVPMDWTNAYSALDKGLVEAVCTPTTHMIMGKLTNVAKYVTINFFITSAQSSYLVNLDVWRKLPENIRDLLLEEAQETARKANNEFIQRADTDCGELDTSGAIVNLFPKDERAKLKRMCHLFVDQYLAELGDIGQYAKQAIELANSQNHNK
jgi:TRAP-type C4-dicarboxylate transport system substrate-binding protein